jgi:hypothetical protein
MTYLLRIGAEESLALSVAALWRGRSRNMDSSAFRVPCCKGTPVRRGYSRIAISGTKASSARTAWFVVYQVTLLFIHVWQRTSRYLRRATVAFLSNERRNFVMSADRPDVMLASVTPERNRRSIRFPSASTLATHIFPARYPPAPLRECKEYRRTAPVRRTGSP